MTNPFDSPFDQPADMAADPAPAASPAPEPAAKAKPKAKPTPRATADAAAVASAEQDTLTNDDPQAEQQDRIAKLQAQIDAIEDGIYFGLPDEVYHGVPRLSSSAIQQLCISPATWWKDSWLDPNRAPLDEESTKAQVIGKAYHTARLEPDQFDARYVRALDKAELPKGALISGPQMGEALEKLGAKKSGNVLEQAARLIEYGYTGVVWHNELAKWEADRAGRIALPAVTFDQIVDDMERIKASPEVAELLTGGAAEVSIFWTDKHGLKCKARVDYLAPEHWADFKTFDNTRGKELDQAIADAFRYNRYYIQPVMYRDAIEAIREGLTIVGEATEAERDLIAHIQLRPYELACHYVFQEKGGVPNLLGYEVDFYHLPLSTLINEFGAAPERIALGREMTQRRSGLFLRALTDIERAKEQFVLYAQAYDPGQPWAPLEPRRRLHDGMFNSYWLEGKQ